LRLGWPPLRDRGDTLAAAIGLLAAGVLLRLGTPVAAFFFAGTVLIGAAIAVGNVVLPALIKRDFSLGLASEP